MKRGTCLAVACGLIPLAAVHFAYWMNIQDGQSLAPEYICNPYLDGCVSTSRAVRSGPGLLWFKLVTLPVAVLMLLTWANLSRWMSALGPEMPVVRCSTVLLGYGGAIALTVYVIWLGTEGDMYRWLRRYGVVFFFGFTALAQLLAARFTWNHFAGSACASSAQRAPRAVFGLALIVALQWIVGVFSVLKRYLFVDSAFIDILENVTEWWMIVLMCLGFVLLGFLLATAPGPADSKDCMAR